MIVRARNNDIGRAIRLRDRCGLMACHKQCSKHGTSNSQVLQEGGNLRAAARILERNAGIERANDLCALLAARDAGAHDEPTTKKPVGPLYPLRAAHNSLVI
jgi:hypothetical protein